MAAGIDLIRELGVRSQGREPVWAPQTDYTDTPNSSAAGVDVTGAIVAGVLCALRQNPAVHTSRAVVGVADLTLTTYTVTVDGTAVAYDASAGLPSDQDMLLTAIADAINADGVVGLIVTATAVDSDFDGILDTVELANILGTTHTTAVGVAGGTGTLTANEDASAASLRVWVQPEYRAEDVQSAGNLSGAPIVSWVLANNGSFGPLDTMGFGERINVAGFSRVYVEAHTITGPSGTGLGRVLIQSGPCGDEGIS